MRLRVPLLVTSLCLLAGPAAAGAAGDPIMPLSEVRADMECTGYSVFRGQRIDPFAVTILDVVAPSATGGLEPRILFRVHGAEIERTGIARGFSGSPIYCPGADGVVRVAGAASEGVGDYGDLTALATPIEQVIGTPVLPPLGADPKIASRWSAAGRARSSLLRRRYRLTAPLTVGGVTRPVLRGLQQAGARRGVTLLQSPGPTVNAPATFGGFRPGGAVGTSYTSGELSLGGIGTISYVDGADVWAFGHQLEGVGRRALYLQDASISTVIVNPTTPLTDGSSYKLGAATRDVGTLSSDGFNAVAGTTGALPPQIPVHVEATDTDTGKTLATDFRAADETAVGNPSGVSGLAFGAPTAIVQAPSQVLGSAPIRNAGELCFQVRLRERRAPLRFCNRYVADGLSGVADGSLVTTSGASMAADASTALALLDAFSGRKLHVTGVQAQIEVTRGQRMSYLREVRLPRQVRPGRRVRGTFVVKVVRGGTRRIAFTWTVPPTLRPGRRTLTFEGSEPDGGVSGLFDDLVLDLSGDEEADAPSGPAGPATVKGLARAFKALQTYDGVRLSRPRSRVYTDPDYRIGGTARTRVRVRR